MDEYLASLMTEKVNEETTQIDQCDTAGILQMINREDRRVSEAVEKVIPQIAQAVDMITEAMKKGGRLFYFGAGTSGRLGILDASECPPTYGVDPSLVQGYIAGGDQALRTAVEGSEDSEELGRSEIGDRGVTRGDVVVGITASGRTPYVLGVVRQAAKVGARTIGIATNPNNLLQEEVEVCITPVVGPEVITGSTRMKSGTAQKMVLNMLTTASMIRLGKVYGNRMVDLKASNVKLVERAKRIFSDVTGEPETVAQEYLAASGMETKLAVMMFYSGLDSREAAQVLEENRGSLRQALSAISD
ncbi:MAG: N-acetylmuramic acid 6-phosphate etherase [Lachnospiraceae bacterium]|nr:N-acetylmuramic acid 6-phosphate etherase [Lachnospiraceae bacterium]